MKKSQMSLALVLFFIFGVAACSSGGEEGLPGEEIASSTSCSGEDCTETSIHEAGDFTLGEVTMDTTEALPDMNVSNDGDTLTLSCPDDANTEDGMIMFNCNLDDYYAVYAVCVHGVVNFASESDTSTFYTSSCQSIDAYCDSYGFSLGESCNTSNLVQDLSVDENIDTNADKFLDIVEDGFVH